MIKTMRCLEGFQKSLEKYIKIGRNGETMYYGKETGELKKQEKSMKVFLVMIQMEKWN